MSATSRDDGFDVVVGGDGTLRVSAAELARHGVTPGSHLRIVPESDPRSRPPARTKLHGLLVGKIPVEEILSWEDFEAASLVLPDPFDGAIVATARTLELPLISRDSAVTDARVVEVIW
jgi:hypothetical protein